MQIVEMSVKIHLIVTEIIKYLGEKREYCFFFLFLFWMSYEKKIPKLEQKSIISKNCLTTIGFYFLVNYIKKNGENHFPCRILQFFMDQRPNSLFQGLVFDRPKPQIWAYSPTSPFLISFICK